MRPCRCHTMALEGWDRVKSLTGWVIQPKKHRFGVADGAWVA